MAIVGATRHSTPSSSPSVRLPPSRMRLVGMGLGLLFVALLGRSIYLQLVKQDFLQNQGAARYSRSIQLEAYRGVITDRNGEPLAISTPVQSIWASPADMEPVPVDKINQLARLLVLVPLLSAHRFLEPPAIAQTFGAFVAFGLCASGTYLLNDLLDLAPDRLHPRKRRRPSTGR